MTSQTSGLFQADRDLEIVRELDAEAFLTKVMEEKVAEMKAQGDEEAARLIHYTIYGGGSDPEFVREYMDRGMFEALFGLKAFDLNSDIDMNEAYSARYVYVIVGACAMSLGCKIPADHFEKLKSIYTEAGLTPDALPQMRKALFGPNGYKTGEPYDFEPKIVNGTANSLDEDY